MGKALNLGKIFGIQIRLHLSWFIIFILLTAALVDPKWSQWLYWLLGIITSLLFFASVLTHELAHSLVAKANDIPVKSITLFIFGGIAHMTKEAANPRTEFKMAIAGPACSLLIGGLFYLLAFFILNDVEPISTMIQWLALINLALAAFNMIPGLPLDGGHVLRSILWRVTGNYGRSTTIAIQIGRGVGFLFIALGILTAFLQPFGLPWFSGLWLAFIGWFLENAASASHREAKLRQTLQGTTAATVMTYDYSVVPSNISLNQMVQEYILPSGRTFFLVADEGNLKGTVTLQDIRTVRRENWSATQVKEVMTLMNKVIAAYPNQDIKSILEQMDENNITQMPVVSENKVIGLITRNNLVRFLRTHTELQALVIT